MCAHFGPSFGKFGILGLAGNELPDLAMQTLPSPVNYNRLKKADNFPSAEGRGPINAVA
jgi:hypothetical protein